MKIIHQFLAALDFLTVLPAAKKEYSLADVADGLWAFPIAGLVAGLLLSCAGIVIYSLFPAFPASVILLILWAVITGGLHLDGLIDCCDGLFAPRPEKERLAILKDVAAGSFGVIGAVLFLLLKLSCLAALKPKTIVLLLPLILVTGRTSMLYSIFRFPYAREQGTGKIFREKIRISHLFISAGIIVLVCIISSLLSIPFYFGPVAFGICWLMTELTGIWVLRRIPGFTGDVYGAVCELNEVFILITAVLFFRGNIPPIF